MPPTLSISNRLLRSLAADDLDPLRPHLHAVTLSHKQALSTPRTPIKDVYSVQDGVVSLVQPAGEWSDDRRLPTSASPRPSEVSLARAALRR